MINETANATQQITTISFEHASEVLQSTPILAWVIVTWFAPLVLYLIIGSVTKGRSSNGAVSSKPMILYPNFWFAVMVWGFIQLCFFVLLVFPIWLRWL